MRTAAVLIAVAALLAGVAPLHAAPAPPRVVNGTDAAPYMKPWGGPLLFSDSPEDLRSPGLTDAARLGGRFRLLDYHVNLTREALWVGAVLENPHPYPVTLTVRDGVAGILGSLAAERRFVIRWFARRAHPAPRSYVLLPGGSVAFVRRIPPRAVSARVMDLSTRARGREPRLEVRTVAVRRRSDATGPLAVLPRQVGLLRAVFPHAEVTGRWAPGPLDRSVALDLGEVSGPDVGYAAASDTLPGEAQAGADVLDYGPFGPRIWQKGGYAMIERLRIVAGSPGHVVNLTVLHPGTQVVALGRALRLVGRKPLRLAGRPVTLTTTVLPGQDAPIRIVLSPSRPADPAPRGWAPVHYGWAYGDPSAPPTIRLEIPPVAWTPSVVRLAPAVGGVGAAIRPGLGIWARGAGHVLRDWVTGAAARGLVTMAVPFPLHQLDFKSTAPASYWLDLDGMKTLLVFRDDPPAPAWMGPDGGSAMAGGVAVWLPAGAVRRPVRLGIRVGTTLPRLPRGLVPLTPVIAVTGTPRRRLHRPPVLDLDNQIPVDEAAGAGRTLVLLALRSGRAIPLPTGNGATWLASGNERAYPIPGYGRYVMAEAAPAGHRP